MSDDLGDRMKLYESVSTSRRAFKGQPLIVRLDGNAFHTFTRGLERPFCKPLSDLMIETMKALVDKFNAAVGYTQSDEITLVILSKPEDKGELLFNGRLQKIESLSAAYATAFFNKQLPFHLPEKAHELPIFDSRAFVVPNEQEAYHEILWRQQDCTKNAISMAAQAMFSHRELQHKSGPEMQEMMFKGGINFNDYPSFFKRGTFARREKVFAELLPEDYAKIPEKYRPKGPIERSVIAEFDLWLSKAVNPVKSLFGDPVL